MLVPAQVRMARAAVGFSVRELAQRSGVADSTILRFETGKGDILTANLGKLQATLEAAGVVFVSADDAAGAGVRLKR
ncbi:XRE family transcriptional regulator [Caulobacter endophyticus]|uniref:XRE family transcriptional regulator n=2 Tax=Caulobacter endophyticus TaxID=2172652 RepID=A0A2T9KCG4_9CAUL|nr:XRE family transcriptional regulator [Caulobacter endophyticus]